MKRLSILILSLVVLFGACDILDSQEPRQEEPLNTLYNSTEGLENALTGAYNDAQSGDAMGSSLPLFGETMTDNVSWSGSFDQWDAISSHDIDVTNSQIEAVWNQTYEVINDVNLIIETVDAGDIDDPDFSQAADRIRGEALFIRAMMHFEAVRMWAKPWDNTPSNDHLGVPLVMSGTDSPEEFTNGQRVTVAEIYLQVKTDLSDAIDLLSGYDAGDAGRANQWNARAYLARVNLQQGNFDEVATLTQEVINSNEYELAGASEDYFFTPSEETSSEAVFDIVHTVQDNPGVNNSLSTFYASTDDAGRGDIQYTSDYVSALDEATPASQENDLETLCGADCTFQDLRETELLQPSTQATLKYNSGSDTDDNAPVIRYADVLLMRAEALAEQATAVGPGTDAEAAEDLLNQVRLRSLRVQNASGGTEDPGLYFAYEEGDDYTSPEELLDLIYLERRVEFAFEGKRKHDLQRWGMDVPAGTSPNPVTPPDGNDILWPIPESECDANPDIAQNSGYGQCDG